MNDNISVFEVKDELPENWKENNEERSREFVSKKNNYLNSLDKKYKIAWDIIYSIRNMIPKLIWKEKKEFIISIVFEEGKNVEENDIVQLATWRIKSYISSGIEI